MYLPKPFAPVRGFAHYGPTRERSQRHQVLFGDFLRGKFRPTGCAWDPWWETHRGQAVFDRAGAKKIRMTISFAPNKDDSTGEKKLHGSVLLDLTPGSLSCAAAVLEMLEGSPLPPGVAPEDVPLFLDPATGREMTHEYAQERLTTLIRCV